MAITSKQETVTEQRNVRYISCDRPGCKTEAKAQGLESSAGWGSWVRLSKEDLESMRMMDKLLGKELTNQMLITKTQSLCPKCSDLFEQFVNGK